MYTISRTCHAEQRRVTAARILLRLLLRMLIDVRWFPTQATANAKWFSHLSEVLASSRDGERSAAFSRVKVPYWLAETYARNVQSTLLSSKGPSVLPLSFRSTLYF